MKAFYICDKAKRTCRHCGNPCTMTADPKHARNKNKHERYFVIYPNGRYMAEVETLQEMESKAQEIREAINTGKCYF